MVAADGLAAVVCRCAEPALVGFRRGGRWFGTRVETGVSCLTDGSASPVVVDAAGVAAAGAAAGAPTSRTAAARPPAAMSSTAAPARYVWCLERLVMATPKNRCICGAPTMGHDPPTNISKNAYLRGLRPTHDLGRQLHPRIDLELGVDMGELGLHGTRRAEEIRRDRFVGKAFPVEARHLNF